MITKQFLKDTADEIDAGIAGSAFILLLIMAIGFFIHTAMFLLSEFHDIVFWVGFIGVLFISIFALETASEHIQFAAIPAVLPVSILAFLTNGLYFLDIASDLVATFSVFVFGFVVIGSVTSAILRYFSREDDVGNDFHGENVLLEGDD